MIARVRQQQGPEISQHSYLVYRIYENKMRGMASSRFASEDLCAFNTNKSVQTCGSKPDSKSERRNVMRFIKIWRGLLLAVATVSWLAFSGENAWAQG